jgi:hypothetical protein
MIEADLVKKKHGRKDRARHGRHAHHKMELPAAVAGNIAGNRHYCFRHISLSGLK